jgi:hypothetical protein
MSFLEFLESFRGSWLLDDGFLRTALRDHRFPDIQSRAALDVYLVVHNADAKTREEARRFWDEYEGLRDGGVCRP